jgi:hypothetical protein
VRTTGNIVDLRQKVGSLRLRQSPTSAVASMTAEEIARAFRQMTARYRVHGDFAEAMTELVPDRVWQIDAHDLLKLACIEIADVPIPEDLSPVARGHFEISVWITVANAAAEDSEVGIALRGDILRRMVAIDERGPIDEDEEPAASVPGDT